VTDTDPEWQDYRRAVGDRLRTARTQPRLTQEMLAEAAGVSRDTVQRVERGDARTPRLLGEGLGTAASARAAWRGHSGSWRASVLPFVSSGEP
jgi:DNA-binding XRE family transcriptional regulator